MRIFEAFAAWYLHFAEKRELLGATNCTVIHLHIHALCHRRENSMPRFRSARVKSGAFVPGSGTDHSSRFFFAVFVISS